MLYICCCLDCVMYTTASCVCFSLPTELEQPIQEALIIAYSMSRLASQVTECI